MSILFDDTDPRVERLLVDGYRAMPAWLKLQRVFEASDLIRELALMNIRDRHPAASEPELRMALAERCMGRELVLKLKEAQHLGVRD